VLGATTSGEFLVTGAATAGSGGLVDSNLSEDISMSFDTPAAVVSRLSRLREFSTFKLFLEFFSILFNLLPGTRYCNKEAAYYCW